MTITLSVGATTVTLHPDLYWADEFDWHPVQQNVERSLTGALIVDLAAIPNGRPISLRPIDNRSAWMTRATVEQLQDWAATPGQEMELVLRGVTRTVMWRHQNPPALSAEPVVHMRDADEAAFHLVRLNLMEI